MVCREPQRGALTLVDLNLEFVINKVWLQSGSEVNARMVEKTQQKQFVLNLSIHNCSQRVIEPNAFSLSLVIPEPIDYEPSYFVSSTTRISDHDQILNLQIKERLFPDSWCSLQIPCSILTKSVSSIENAVLVSVCAYLLKLGPKTIASP